MLRLLVDLGESPRLGAGPVEQQRRVMGVGYPIPCTHYSRCLKVVDEKKKSIYLYTYSPLALALSAIINHKTYTPLRTTEECVRERRGGDFKCRKVSLSSEVLAGESKAVVSNYKMRKGEKLLE